MMACGTAAGRLSRVLGTQSPVERVSSYGLGRHRAGPWMNRCGLTSGKKSLVTAQNNNELKKNNQGVQQRSKLDTGARLEMFPGQAIKKKKKNPPLQEDWRCLSQTGRPAHPSLTVFLASFLLQGSLGLQKQSSSTRSWAQTAQAPLPPSACLHRLIIIDIHDY